MIDKNIPPSPGAWRNVSEICSETGSGGYCVLVLLDAHAFRTTEIELAYRTEGDGGPTVVVKHVYPFLLAYLAVCMGRVMVV